MKIIFTVLLIIPLILSFKTDEKSNSKTILKKSQKSHDPKNKWESTVFKLHIQEPRVGNPERYSKIIIDNVTNSFEIERNRHEGIIKRIITSEGEFKAMMNDDADVPKDIIEKYGLNKERSMGYKNFYTTIYGLPMSITEEIYLTLGEPESIDFDGHPAYRIDVELKEPMISDQWRLIISSESFSLLAIEIIFPDNPSKNERIKLDGSMEVNSVKIPQFRDWYYLENDEYLGSDIIVKQMN